MLWHQKPLSSGSGVSSSPKVQGDLAGSAGRRRGRCVAWEHASYLQYKNDKKTFVEQWWNVVNWADVQARFEKSKTQTPGLIIP